MWRRTPVRAARFDGGANQHWRFDTGKDGNALIISRLGKTLDIPGGTSEDGARVQIYDIDGDSNQRFMFRRVAGGSGFIETPARNLRAKHLTDF